MSSASPREHTARWSPTAIRRAALLGAAAVTLSLTCAVPVAAFSAEPADPGTLGEVNIDMQAQEEDQWCWAASGNTIAAHHGVDITQTKFCQLAHNEENNQGCANEQGVLEDAQRAFGKLDFANPGESYGSPLEFDAVAQDIDAGQPIETRIGWKNGGGHMHVIYGAGDGKVSWGDPWPDNQRYSTANYDAYVNNNEFQWTHTLAGIGR